MAGNDLVFQLEHILDVGVTDFVAPIAFLPVLERVYPVACDEDSRIEVLEKRCIGAFDDERSSSVARRDSERLIPSALAARAHRLFGALSGPGSEIWRASRERIE